MRTEAVKQRPVLLDDLEYGVQQGVFIWKNGQLTMNPDLSYQDCVNFKENYRNYQKFTQSEQKKWDKEQKKLSV